ncbi:MAG: CvpA family protein [Planctomycetota bacterium]
MSGGIDLSAISYIDLAALAILLLMGIRGILKGFVSQAASLVTLVGGLIVARHLAPHVRWIAAQLVPGKAEGSNVDLYVAYFVIFVLVMIAVAIVAKLLKNAIGALKLQSYDRLLGGLFGLLLGGVIVLVVVLGLSYIDSEGLQKQMSTAYAPRYAETVVAELDPLFPEEVQQKLRHYIEEAKKRLPGAAADTVIEGESPESKGEPTSGDSKPR